MRLRTLALGMAGLSLAITTSTAVSTSASTAASTATGPRPVASVEPAYVALGDSYSSGTGTRRYLKDGSSCLRSVYAYPSLIAASRGYALNFRACSGATVPDVTRAQLSALDAGTNYVSISAGGNDAGFADVLTECALPAWMSNCYGAINSARGQIRNRLPSSLDTLYGRIDARAPSATVVVVGYPRIFNGDDCHPFTWFSRSEQNALNGTGDLLNRLLRAEAARAGFRFANPTSRFSGHAVCDDVEWINGLTFPIVESFHPNRKGHAAGYTPLVSPKLTGAKVPVTGATLDRARSSARELATEQRAYAEVDRSIRPERVRAPDLDSARARRAAREHGVDLSSQRSIDRADRRASRAQSRRWNSGR